VDLGFFEQVVALALKHGTMVLHDFAYADLGFEGYTPPSILQWRAQRGGRRDFLDEQELQHGRLAVGYCVGNPRMIRALARIKSYLDYGVFQPSRSLRSSRCASARPTWSASARCT